MTEFQHALCMGFGVGVFTTVFVQFFVRELARSVTTPAKKRERDFAVDRIEAVDGGDVIVHTREGRSYRGSCTVWHRHPSGRRAPSDVEARLSDVWTRYSWEQRERSKRRLRILIGGAVRKPGPYAKLPGKGVA